MKGLLGQKTQSILCNSGNTISNVLYILTICWQWIIGNKPKDDNHQLSSVQHLTIFQDRFGFQDGNFISFCFTHHQQQKAAVFFLSKS